MITTRFPPLSTPASIFVSMCIGALVGSFRHRSRIFTTTFTKFGAYISVDFVNGFRPDRSVPMADITYLEYRSESGGGEEPVQPSGLCAETKWSCACRVPYINDKQTALLLDILYRRFPHVREIQAGWPPRSFATTSSG